MTGHGAWLTSLLVLTSRAALASAGWTLIHHLLMLGPQPVCRGSLLSEEPVGRCWTLSTHILSVVKGG